MLAKYKRSLGVLAALAASATWCGTAVAQNISAVPTGTVPTQPDQPLSVKITNTPELDTIIGYNFKVSYKDSQVDFVDVEDAEGAEAFDGEAGPGQSGDEPAAGYSDFIIVEGNTLSAVADRGDLILLNFITGDSYTGSLDLHIESYPTPTSGLTVDNDGDIEHPAGVTYNSGTVFTVPTLSSISQHYNVIDEATADYTITVNGSNFESDSVVEFDGVALTTSFISPTQLTATLPFDKVNQVGEWLINVDNGNNVESNTKYYTAVSQATVQVDDDFAGSHEQRIDVGQIFGVNVFDSIQAAENAVDEDGTVEVAAGDYVETVIVDNDKISIEGSAGANLTAPTSGANGALIDVRADDVTVQGLNLTVNRPYVTAGVVIQNPTSATDYDNLSVIGNTFAVTGLAESASAEPYVGFETKSVAIAARNEGPQTKITVAGNVIGSAAAPFDRAVYTRVVRGTIGGSARFDAVANPATKGNIIYGENHDLCIQFVSNGTMLVQNNALRGWGYDGFKGAQVDFTEPNSNGSIQVLNNLFEPQADGAGRSHARSLMIKNNGSTPNITIRGNEFKLRKVGILAGNSIGTTIDANIFTPVSGVADSIAVAISNKVPTSSVVAPDPIGATITGNFFNGGDVAGNTAIEFMNHNSTPVPSGGLYGNIVVGTAGNENEFGANLSRFIVLNNESGPSSGSTYDWANDPGLGVTTMAPFAATIVAKDNLFDLGDGLVSPADLSLEGMDDLEAKVQHKRDFAALGSVLFYLRVENLDTEEYFDYVQDAIDDPDTEAGNEIAVSAGEYLELIDVTKANLILTGTGKPVIKARATETNARLMEILADGVTIDGFEFDMAANVGGSVIAVGRNSLTVENCDFVLTGATGGTLTGMPAAYGSNWGPKAVVFGGNGPANSSVTLKSNTFASETAAFFMYGAQVYHANAVVGGVGEANTFSNAYRDLLLTQTGGTIEYNSFAGNVDVSNSYASVTFFENNFGNDAQQHNEAALTIRGVQQPAGSVTVNTNHFVNTARGIWVGASKNVSITGNDFTPDNDITIVAGDSTEPTDRYNHIIVDSSFVTSSNGAATPEIGVTVTGNTFNDNGVGNGVAVELRNTNTNPSTFSSLVFGTAANPNIFSGDLTTYVNIADGFVQEVDFTNNQFAGTLGTDFDRADGFAAEDKINHKLDDEDLALVRVTPATLYVTQLSNSIQRGIDASSENHTLHVQAGEYVESTFYDVAENDPAGIVINKVGLKVYGPNFNVAGTGTRNDEAVIVPGTQLAVGNNHDWAPVVGIAADSVEFAGFKVSGNSSAVDGLDIAGMDIDAATGILTEADNVKILNNVAENFSFIGIWSGGWPENDAAVTYDNVEIAYNLVQNVHDDLYGAGDDSVYGYAIYFQGSAGHVHHNTVLNSRNGMQIQPYYMSGAVTKAEFNNLQVWRQGLWYNGTYAGAGRWDIENNTITASLRPAVITATPTLWEGIRLQGINSGANGGKFELNTVDGNTALGDVAHDNWGDFANAVWGIHVTGSTSDDIDFIENTVFNVELGLVHAASADLALADNSITANDDVIRLQTAYVGDGELGTVGGDGSIDATAGNSFNGIASGSATLPQLFDIEDAVTHKLDDEDLGLVRVIADTLYVTQLSNSIQRGVDASDVNDTLHVEAGNYLEETKAHGGDNTALLINKNGLKVYGPNSAVAGSETRNPEANVYAASQIATGAIDDDEPVVYISSPNVEFAGFHVSGDTPGDTGLSIAGLDVHACTGIYTQADGVKVNNNLVTNAVFIGIRSGALNSTDPNWIHQDVEFVGNKVTATYDLAGTPTDVDDWRYYMIGIYFQGSTGKVNGNVVENLPYGIQIQPYHASGTVAEVKNNEISAWRRALWYNYANASADRWMIESNIITSVARPSVITGASTAWEGIRLENINNGAKGGFLNLNSVDGTAAMTDPAHDSWGSFANAVWGIHVTASSSENIVFENSKVENVEHALVYAANADQVLTSNKLSAEGDVIRVQRTVNGSGALSSAGGQGNIDATGGNTFNGVVSGTASPVQLFDIEDAITHKVDNEEVGLVRVIADNIYVTGNDNTINSGVVAAEEDDIVNVKNGTYGGDVLVDKYVTLLAQTQSEVLINTASAGVVLDLPDTAGTLNLNGFDISGTAAQGVVVNAVGSAGQFNLQNLAIQNMPDSSFGVVVESSANVSTIENVDITGSGTGIVLANSANLTVSDCDIIDNYGSGILVWKWDVNGVTPVVSDKITLQKNLIIGNGVTEANGENPMVVDNVEAYGILVALLDAPGGDTVSGSSAANLSISNNVITGNAATGIFLSQVSADGSGSSSVSGNTIDGNGLSGTITANPTSLKNTDGIKVNSSRNVAVNNNFIRDNLRYGVQVRSLDGEPDAGEGVTVTSNHIEGNEPIVYEINKQPIGGGLIVQLIGNPAREINAINNWWGHVYGPFNPTLYPVGRGDAYDPQVGTADVSPWYGERPANQIWYALNDRDGDGILDAYEDISLNGTKELLESDRAVKDSDGDTFEDGVEVALGSDPWDAGSLPDSTHDLFPYAKSTADADGDGYKDFYEVAHGTEPNPALGGADDYPTLGLITTRTGAEDEAPIAVDTDLTALRQVLVGTIPMTHTSVEQQNMDLNRDMVITNIDAIALRRHLDTTIKQPLPLK